MKRLLSFLLFGAVLVLTHGFWLPIIGTTLLVKDQPQKADAIVVLRGEEYFRIGKAAELQKQGLAPVIVTAVTPKTFQSFDMIQRLTGYDKMSETEITYKIFKYFGVDDKDVLLAEGEVSSTFQEAVAAKELFLKKRFRSMVLVTSTYHMQRSMFTFREVFKGTGVDIYPVTAAHEFYEPRRWWLRERDVRRVIEEYGSFIFNWIYHFILKKHSTSFDTV